MTRKICAIALGVLLAADAGSLTAYADEAHSEINKAQTALNEARDGLRHAARDFGGYRDKAIAHIGQALSDLDEAKKYDKQ